MTNTRITDSEVFERRYPVILREFSLRPDTHGKGQHNGGDGVIRDIEFRIPVQVSILSERRVYHPYGMAGGEDAACGKNVWVRKVPKVKDSDAEAKTNGVNGVNGHKEEEQEYREVSLGAKNSVPMQPGERIKILTPGGGGWGPVGKKSEALRKQDPKQSWKGGSVASRQAEAEASA